MSLSCVVELPNLAPSPSEAPQPSPNSKLPSYDASSHPSVPTSTPAASTIHTLHLLVLLELLPRHTADARRIEVRLLGLHASQTTKLLIALLLPLGDEIAVGVVVLQQPVVEGFRDGFLFVVEVVDIPRSCRGDS